MPGWIFESVASSLSSSVGWRCFHVEGSSETNLYPCIGGVIYVQGMARPTFKEGEPKNDQPH